MFTVNFWWLDAYICVKNQSLGKLQLFFSFFFGRVIKLVVLLPGNEKAEK
jgi:hypothetical protein